VYQWLTSPNQFTQTATGLCPGNYNVIVLDNNNCNVVPSVTIGQPTALSVSLTAADATCGNADGNIFASPAGGTTPYSYAWTNGDTQQTADSLAAGNYSVTVTDANGCTASSSDSLNIVAVPQPICLITVDSTSTKNVIVWEKPIAGNIDSFRVYRNINSSMTYIGALPYSALSMYTDSSAGVDPKVQAYEYGITVLDTCGIESAISPTHITIHQATPQFTPPNTFDLSWTDYQGFSFTQYYILRDNNNDGTWIKIDSVPFALGNQYTDAGINHPIPTDSARYIIDADPAMPCNASIKNPETFATTVKSSKSNQSDKIILTSVQQNNLNDEINIYPNPNPGVFEIPGIKNKNSKIEIYNTTGELIYRKIASSQKTGINLADIANGVYQVKKISDSGVINRKVVISR
jgi:hypothetical protein